MPAHFSLLAFCQAKGLDVIVFWIGANEGKGTKGGQSLPFECCERRPVTLLRGWCPVNRLT